MFPLLGLLQFIPEIAHLFSSNKVADLVDSPVAKKVLDIAQVLTGTNTPDAASAVIQGDPATALAFKKAVLDQQVTLEQLAAAREKVSTEADIAEETAMTDRAAKLEGTAGDLKAIPYLGPVLLVLRGGQRVLIGYGVVYIDYMVFSGVWKLPDGPIVNAWFATNLLVLSFLFGERAVRNIAPLLTDFMAAKSKL